MSSTRWLWMIPVCLLLVPARAGVGAAGPGGPLLHPLFADHMVLQRGAGVPVWGWAPAGTPVRVRFAGQDKTVRAGEDGRWLANLDPLEASSEPRTLTVTVGPAAAASVLTVTDVLVGDVWLCSGQSNMEFPVRRARDAEQEMASADQSTIRMFTTATAAAAAPASVPPEGYTPWQVTSPGTVGDFSAVGYFFGRRLHEVLGVPIGLIHSSWGGTYIESWTSAQALAAAPVSAAQAADVRSDTAIWRTRFHRDAGAMLDDWFATHDPGSVADAFADPRLDDAGWAGPAAPAAAWSGASGASRPAMAWFRREVDVPVDWQGVDLTLSLGPIDTEDVTWFNGQRLGGALVPWDGRVYTVPRRLVRAGRNVIAVRVVCHSEACGFHGDPADLHLGPEDGGRVSLADGWRVRVSSPAGREPYRIAADPWVPASLFNAKIAPLLPYGIRGVIWYQGEQNTSAPGRYDALLTSLIADWRRRFANPALPFGIVQLANFGDRHDAPVDSQWAALRDAQRRVARDVAATGLVVTTDIGDARDIHPRNKQDVGARLAGWALATAYGRGGEWSGPLARTLSVNGAAARVTFDHAGGGLVATGGRLAGFEIAGGDGRFVRADARIDGDTVVVSSPAVAAPRTVRYAWDDDPEGTLANAAGLPASPFEASAPASPRRRAPLLTP